MASDTRSIKAVSVNFTADLTGWGKGLKTAANGVDKFYDEVRKTLAESPFGKAAKSVSDFAKGLKALSASVVRPLKPLTDGIANIAKKASQAVVAVAKLATGLVAMAAAGVTATLAFSKGGFERIGKLGDDAKQIGIAGSKLSELQYIAIATGGSIEDVTAFLANLRQTIFATVGQLGPVHDAFAALGTTAEQLSRLPIAQQFDAIKRGFEALPGDADRLNAALLIGGEVGLRLSKMLGLSASQYDMLAKKAKATGFAVSDKDIAKIQAANNAFAQIGLAVDGIQNKLSIALAPAIETVSNLFTNWLATVDSNGTFFQTFIDKAVTGFARLVDTVVQFGISVKRVFADVSQTFGIMLQNIFKGILELASVIKRFTGSDALVNIGLDINSAGTNIRNAASSLSDSAKKNQAAFDKLSPGKALLARFDAFNKAVDAQATKQAKAAEAGKKGVDVNRELLDAIGKTETAWKNTIQDAGLTSEQKEIANLARMGAQQKDINKLLMQSNAIREAGKRDSLAEDLRESTKLPIEKLMEDQQRIGQLLAEGKISQTQAIRGLANKTKESGLAEPPKLAGALSKNSIEGRSYLLSQMNKASENPIDIAKKGLSLTGMTNTILNDIRAGINRQQQPAVLAIR